MTDANAGFHIRLASSNGDDAEFILAAWDSTLPFLASIGAGEMWGDQPFSQRAGQRQEVIDVINGTTKEIDGGRRFWIAEVYRAGDIVIGFTRYYPNYGKKSDDCPHSLGREFIGSCWT